MTKATVHERPANTEAVRGEVEIRALMDGIHRAHHDKNAAGITGPYAADASFFSLAPPLKHHGRNRRETQEWLDTWATPIEITGQDFAVTVSGDFAFAHGFLRMQGTKKGAEKGVDFWMRETLCFERQAGAWRIVHEHTSVPFYMDATSRPAFDLKPESR
jgi:ketosteroid isomerase-like protein